MQVWKRLGRQKWVHGTVGVAIAEYLRLVKLTSSLTLEPADIYERLDRDEPFIIAMWHGQHALVPFLRKRRHRAKALVSRHRDGGINAAVVNWLGVEAIRGSGDHGVEFHRKGGVVAFREMLASLAEGSSMVLTADVPKVARVCGLGIVKLAAMSGRPVYPVAVATSRRKEFDSWDRAVLNLPFSRMAGVAGTPVRVAADADDDALETARLTVERELNDATARAYAIVDGAQGRG